MNISEFKRILEMSVAEFESEVDAYLHENYETEAKEALIGQFAEDVGVETEIIEAIFDHNGIDFE